MIDKNTFEFIDDIIKFKQERYKIIIKLNSFIKMKISN